MIAKLVTLDEPGDYRQAIIRIRQIWKSGDVVFPTEHALEEMGNDGLDANDIQNCLRLGRIVSHEKPLVFWRYRIHGKTVDGEQMAVVVETNGHLVIVTAFTRR